ncbi:YbaB/EbfC family nucleoid-associated protein [Actinokineospora pegani]|uniref:YbaB/EbfC family nucleoid-associated protein n=1 Tax=Actinokineospora pegani TaxID=2654637 RepID=UPI0012EA4A96|nr:YbaB/EbfC family nucleoid-associated protein [Actinokineospora pegani]
MSAELERLTAEFERFRARISAAEAKFSGVGEMQARVAELEVTATSPDRTVRVVAGAGGMVKDIQLGADALRRPAPALSEMIMATLREAVAEAARRQADIVDETVGGAFGLATGEQVRAIQAEALGTAPADAASQPGAARQPRDYDEDFDDFGDGSIYDQRRGGGR